VRWTYPYDDWTPPAVEDGTVFVPAPEEPALVGLDAPTGRETWRASLPGRPRTPPAFSNDRERLFVAVDGGRVCGVDRADGAVRWTRPVYGEVATPLAVNLYLVVAATTAGELYCFTTEGDPYWRRNLHAHLEAPPVVGDERVYVGGMDGRVQALDRRNGGLAWEREVAGFLQRPMALDGPHLYVSGGRLSALDVDTGEVAWRYESPEGVNCAPAVVGDTVLVGTDDGRLAALDAAGGGWLSGPERWSVSLGSYVGHWLAAAGGRVYAPVMPREDEGGPTRLVAVA
jgi:outer membrane protein assembly factor BamB